MISIAPVQFKKRNTRSIIEKKKENISQIFLENDQEDGDGDDEGVDEVEEDDIPSEGRSRRVGQNVQRWSSSRKRQSSLLS